MTTTLLEPPTAVAAQTVEPRRIRLRRVTGAGVVSLFGAALGAIGATWVVFERVLPLSGGFGFWVCAYLVFLALYASICSTQWPRKVVVDRLVAVLLATAGLLVLAVVLDQIAYTVFRGSDALGHANFFTKTMALA